MCKYRYVIWHMQRSPVQHSTEDLRTPTVEKMTHVEKGWGRVQLFNAKHLCHFNVHCLSPSLEVNNLWIHDSFTFGGRVLCSFAGWKLRSPITRSCAGCFWMWESGYSRSSLVLFLRTLLALGCHVGIADEHAEEKVKKMKLPKK